MTMNDIQARIARNEAQLAKARADLAALTAGHTVENLTLDGARLNVEGIAACLSHLRGLLPS
jgi:hypothetical protein